MELEQIIDEIVEKVLDRLKSITKKKILILDNSNEEYKKIENLLSKDYSVDIKNKIDDEYDYVIIPKSKFNQLIRNDLIQTKYEDVKLENKNLSIDKKVVTEKDVQNIHKNGIKTIYIRQESLLTPLAMDYINDYNLKVVRLDKHN